MMIGVNTLYIYIYIYIGDGFSSHFHLSHFIISLLLPTPTLLRCIPLTCPFVNPDDGDDDFDFSVSLVHTSITLARRAGSMLYCKLYKVFRWIGGTKRPVTRHKRTVGER